VASVRTRITLTYAAALVGTMVVFGAALFGARQTNAMTDLSAQVLRQADLALRVVQQAREVAEPVTIVRDSLAGREVAPRLRTLLEGVPDYLLVLDDSGRVLYASFAVRQLGTDELATLTRGALALSDSQPAAIVNLGEEELLLRARFESAPGSPVRSVVAGAATAAAVSAPTELVSTMLVIAPLLLLVSILVAYIIAGRALRPIDQLIDAVSAITDGRSLHRRLAFDDQRDELARLAATLNAMIARLETSFGALRRFTADASHELKTPLTVMRASVERAMNPSLPRQERLVSLEEALHETTRMAGLVDSLLTLARFDEGRFDLHREEVRLEPLVRDVHETAMILAEAGGQEVVLSVIEPANVMGDAEQLRKLFLNLITNAIKYTPAGGRIDISLSRRLDSVTFSVRDTGIGISAADLPHVFERFWRADRARSRKPAGDGSTERGGFGLGLAICQWIAQAHGGTLTVQSRLGRGTTFTLSLPPIPDETNESPGALTRHRRPVPDAIWH
jgi:two-component system, OmpR family, sensor kinase